MATNPVLYQISDGVARITLNRAALHNAFDDVLIARLTEVFKDVAADAAVRVAVLDAKGKSFSAGADLNWMRRMADFKRDENLADIKKLAELLHVMDSCPKPTIAVVQGAAYGGGVGLVAACDIALAAERASFCLSEVRLGLIPATISPYVVRAMGVREARRYFLSAERFDAATAWQCGLVHEVMAVEDLAPARDALIESLLHNGPAALAASKELIGFVGGRPIDAAVRDGTAERMADVRASAEGKEGVSAFLEKRKPNWIKGE